MRYWVVYETADDDQGWSAYLPDVPGCVAAAETRAEVERLIREALTAHLALMREDGDPMPEPSAWPWAEEIDVDIPEARSVEAENTAPRAAQ
jgi:predicted RNase H-like HicB family nuclease